MISYTTPALTYLVTVSLEFDEFAPSGIEGFDKSSHASLPHNTTYDICVVDYTGQGDVTLCKGCGVLENADDFWFQGVIKILYQALNEWISYMDFRQKNHDKSKI